MPRKPSDKPWLHKSSGFWCATVNKRREYLDRDFKLACRKLKALRNPTNQAASLSRDWLDATFAELADEFLTDLKDRKGEESCSSYRYRLLRALKVLGPDIRVGELRRFHLKLIERDARSGKSPSTKRDTIGSVIRVFNWAVEFEMLDANPFAGYKKPKGRQRTRIATDNEFWSLLRHSHPTFRNFLLASRLTGCRPKELRTLIWQWVDLDREVWVLPKHKTIEIQANPRPRIIPLHPLVVQLCRRLARLRMS